MNARTQLTRSLGLKLRSTVKVAGVLAVVASIAGCQLWPFGRKERTSIITPAMRMATIQELGPRGREADAAEQVRICEQLAQQIRTEPDPIVRKTIQETIADFNTPLANAVILAGLNDEDRDVRTTCCRLLGQRGDQSAIAPLSRLVASDSDLDVRLAAVDALGEMKTTASVPGLAAALKDRDPALQFAGVESMKKVAGKEKQKELGNDVEAWRQYAAGAGGTAPPNASVAVQPASTTVK